MTSNTSILRDSDLIESFDYDVLYPIVGNNNIQNDGVILEINNQNFLVDDELDDDSDDDSTDLDFDDDSTDLDFDDSPVIFEDEGYDIEDPENPESIFTNEENILELEDIDEIIDIFSGGIDGSAELRSGGEPNDNFATAVDTNLSSAQPNFLTSGIIGNNPFVFAPRDVDFYLVQLNAGDLISIDME